jgi:3-hydroxymyristoyl/3-hydroxydecanoyl-(acyl carrier protein) dehydratase
MIDRLTLPENHPSLAGHFPGHPVVPGVVALTELMTVVNARHGPCRLRHIAKLKFHRLLKPGICLDVLTKRVSAHRLNVRCECGGEIVISASIDCEFADDTTV